MQKFWKTYANNLKKILSKEGNYKLEKYYFKFDNVKFKFKNNKDSFIISISKYNQSHKKRTSNFKISFIKTKNYKYDNNKEKIILIMYDLLKKHESKLGDNISHLNKYFPKSNIILNENDKSNTIKITNFCNIDCCFCLSKNHSKDKIKDLKEIKKLSKEYPIIHLDGGEPTTHPYIKQIIEMLQKDNKKVIGIMTNGIRLSNINFLYELLQKGLTQICMSFVAPTPKISKQVLGYDVYEKHIQALDNIAKLRTRITFTMQSVILSLNQNHINSLIKHYIHYQPDNIILIYCLKVENAKENYSIKINKQKIQDILKEIENNIEEVNIKLRYFPYCMINKNSWKLMQKIESKNLKHHICDECCLKEKCNFPSKDYIEKYPDEINKIIPIKET